MAPPLPDGAIAGCLRIRNAGDTAGIWRIDFEQVFGGNVRFEVIRASGAETVLSNWLDAPLPDRVGAGRWLASLPIPLAPGEIAEVRVAIGAGEEMADADPVLRPETDYDAILTERALGFGGLFGASLLLVVFYIAFARLLQSEPARRYAWYFAATVLTFASVEGYAAYLLPRATALTSGALDLGLEIAQVVFHLAFVLAFLRGAVPGTWLTRSLPALTAFTGALLVSAVGLSLALNGIDGAIAYHDLGYELDPLLEGEGLGIPLLLGAVANLTWILLLLAASVVLLSARADGAGLFALGAGILVAGLVLNSFSEELLPGLGDDHYGLPYIFLLDGVLFAAAIVRQTFGLRDQRDTAIRQELEATQEKMRLADTLLAARRDTARARDLAERHRARLALTGHDLRQPLTSLRLAMTEASRDNPELGRTLATSLDYLTTILDGTLADSRPEAAPEPQDGGHPAAPLPAAAETVPLQVVLSNVVRMFGDEASAKGLSLEVAPTDIAVRTEPVALIRMVANLVANAIKYTDAGTVRVAARVVDDRAVLEVTDTGPGLSADEAEAVQADYVRGAASSGTPGEGIGLSSVQDLAASLGVSLRIASTPGQGACFALEGVMVAER